MLQGIAVSDGIGLGKVLLIRAHALVFNENRAVDPQHETGRFTKAVAAFCANTASRMRHLQQRSPSSEDSKILETHIGIANDPEMNSQVCELIESGLSAEGALNRVCDMYIAMFSDSHDELTRLRAEDIRDVRNALMHLLLGVKDTAIKDAPKGSILVAEELSPSAMADLDTERIVGLVLEKGGPASHASILARTMGLPAVCGVRGAADKLSSGDFVIVDGSRGEVISSPGEKVIAEYWQKREAQLEERRCMEHFRDRHTISADGLEYPLYCNISMPCAAGGAIESGGEGVGLFRTEYLFMNRSSPPSEEEQATAYSQALDGAAGRQVVIRTLDIGGDKNVPCLDVYKEENPFLGLRGVRWCLQNPDVFLTQLRALLRAGAGEGRDLRVMFPMISSLAELRACRQLLEKAREQLINEGKACAGSLPVGVMIETPSAAFIADHLSRETAFMSIGTNDLVGYIMACDRGNPSVSSLYDPFHPAVLRALRHIIQCGSATGTPVCVCGETASDPRLVPLYMSYGIASFSIPSGTVPRVRKTVSLWTKAEADSLSEAAGRLETAREVRELLDSAARM